MPTQSWVSLAPPTFWTADGTALANSTTLTSISPAPDVVIPANYLQIGSRIRVTGTGRFGTTATPTLTLGVYYGGAAGVALATTGALTTPAGAVNMTWYLQAIIDVRTNGTTGTAMCTGLVAGLTSATAVNLIPATAPATATIDTTAAKALVLGATWGTANASNTITCHSWMVETLA